MLDMNVVVIIPKNSFNTERENKYNGLNVSKLTMQKNNEPMLGQKITEKSIEEEIITQTQGSE